MCGRNGPTESRLTSRYNVPMDAKRRNLDRLVGKSLLMSEAIASEIRGQVIQAVTRGTSLETVRGILVGFEPTFAQMLTDAELAAWVLGFEEVAQALPGAILEAFEQFVGSGDVLKPYVPPEGQILRFPAIERAAESLVERNIVTRQVFDELEASAKSRAFTVAYQDTEDTIAAIRDVLAEQVREGASLEGFRQQIEERVNGSAMGPAHLENVYRTNIQRAFHQAHEEAASHPLVEEMFPYQEYLPIHDDRTRPQHLELATLGLSGTGVYRRDDPMWKYFLPPWHYQCRCTVNLLTREQAAAKGVKEAQEWIRTGVTPIPEWRLDAIPFRPEEGWV